jgi:hypothetical protein
MVGIRAPAGRERARRARGQGGGRLGGGENNLFSQGRASWIGETNWDRGRGPGRRTGTGIRPGEANWGSGEGGALASGVARHRTASNDREDRGVGGVAKHRTAISDSEGRALASGVARRRGPINDREDRGVGERRCDASDRTRQRRPEALASGVARRRGPISGDSRGEKVLTSFR